MSLLLQVLVVGLGAGAVYGLVAIGYALVYRLTGVVHFAFGELITLAVFAALFLAAGTGPVTRTNVPAASFALSFLGGVGVAVVSGALLYVVALRPFLRRGSLIGWIGAIVAVAFAVRGFVSAAFTRESYVFPDPLPFQRLGRAGVIALGGGASVQVRTFFVIAAGLTLAASTAWVLERTRFGRAVRAISDDRLGAELVGVPIDRLLALTFGLSGGVAVLVALFQAPAAPITTDTGALLGLKGLVAALLAGFGSPWRAFGAGLVVGLIESTASTLHVGAIRLGPAYGDILPLALAVVVISVQRLGASAAPVE